MVSTSAWHAAGRGSIARLGRRSIMCKNMALYIGDCVSLCLSDETVKAVGPFYLVSMARGRKRSHQSALEMCNLLWTPHSSLEKDNSLNHSCVSPKMGCFICRVTSPKYEFSTIYTLCSLFQSKIGNNSHHHNYYLYTAAFVLI